MTSLQRINKISFKVQCWPDSFSLSPDLMWIAIGTCSGNIEIFHINSSLLHEYHLNVDDDVWNAIPISVIVWTSALWLGDVSSTQHASKGIVAGTGDGHVRLVSCDTRGDQYMANCSPAQEARPHRASRTRIRHRIPHFLR